MESHSGDVERIHSRSEFAIQALQKEAREYQDKIIDLEQRLRSVVTGYLTLHARDFSAHWSVVRSATTTFEDSYF